MDASTLGPVNSPALRSAEAMTHFKSKLPFHGHSSQTAVGRYDSLALPVIPHCWAFFSVEKGFIGGKETQNNLNTALS